jgi:very-short-patch-repair endonuclease
MSNGSDKTGSLGFFFRKTVSPAEPAQGKVTYPYGLRDDFLSPAELSFFRVLKSELPAEWHLVAKVNLADLFFIRQPHRNQAARNRIDRKHVDFVICEALVMKPLLGIELDDSSHEQEDRVERDALVDQVFQAAGLPLLRVTAARVYQPALLMEAVRKKMGIVAGPPPNPGGV